MVECEALDVRNLKQLSVKHRDVQKHFQQKIYEFMSVETGKSLSTSAAELAEFSQSVDRAQESTDSNGDFLLARK